MNRLKALIFIIPVLILIWIIMGIGFEKEKKVTADFPERVEIFQVLSLQTKGSIEANGKEEIYSEISAVIQLIPVKEGDSVIKGQELIILKNTDIEKKYEETKIKLREAELNAIKAKEEFKKLEMSNKTNELQIQMSIDDAEKQLLQLETDATTVSMRDKDTINGAVRALTDVENSYQTLEKDTSQVSQMEVNLKKKDIAEKEALDELRRCKELFEAKVISKKQLDDAQNKYNRAKLDNEQSVKDLDSLKAKRGRDLELAKCRVDEYQYKLDIAREQSAINKALYDEKISSAKERVNQWEEKLAIFPQANRISPEDVAIAEEETLKASNDLIYAGEDYNKTKLHSPIDGEITFINKGVRKGRYITQGTLCMVINNINKLYIKTEVKQEDISQISLKQNVNIYGNGIKKENALEGHVSAIDPITHLTSMEGEKKLIFNVIIDFEIPENNTIKFRPAMDMNLDFITESKKNVLLFYNESIIKQGKKSYIYIYDNGIAKKVEIKTGLSDNIRTEIISGIKEGNQLIKSWQGELSDGDHVKIQE